MWKFLLIIALVFAHGGTWAKDIPQITVLVLGDSLTEGFGVDEKEAYPFLVEQKFHAAGRKEIKIQNAGISGSTSASALSRLKWHLKSKPQWMILALGGNDGLRGVHLKETRKNLSETIELAKKSQVKVVMAGMKLPINYGDQYRKDFEKIYQDLAKKYKTKLIPFLLEGVGGNPELNLPDGIHPNPKGHAIIAEKVFASLVKIL